MKVRSVKRLETGDNYYIKTRGGTTMLSEVQRYTLQRDQLLSEWESASDKEKQQIVLKIMEIDEIMEDLKKEQKKAN
jgi:hypothetical protein